MINITKKNLLSKTTGDDLTGWQLFYLASEIIKKDNITAEMLYDEDISEFIQHYYNIGIIKILEAIHNYHQAVGFTQEQIDYVNKLSE